MLSLFDGGTGILYTQEADFFSTIGTLCSVILDNIQTTHQHHAHDCSIVATFQHRGSSAASESLMVNPFGIYHLMGGVGSLGVESTGSWRLWVCCFPLPVCILTDLSALAGIVTRLFEGMWCVEPSGPGRGNGYLPPF